MITRNAAIALGLVFTACLAPPPPELPAASSPRGANPLKDATLFVDPDSQAADAARTATGESRQLLRRISEQPQADWLGEWTPDVEQTARTYVRTASSRGELRVVVVYNIPNRDCGQYAKGGLADPRAYKRWIMSVAAGIGDGRAAVILEPDALGQLKDCLSSADQRSRLQMIRYAVRRFRQSPNTAVYIDAGNANWLEVDELATRLKGAGIDEAHGFALNVSNYVATDKTIAYGKAVSAKLGGGVGFVVDTSRNGRGEAKDKAWCNPPGRGLGKPPTVKTGDALVHALLWVKRPGESDGPCNGGPPAGQWFQDQALELARNASSESAPAPAKPVRSRAWRGK